MVQFCLHVYNASAPRVYPVIAFNIFAVGNGLFVTPERPKKRQFPTPVLYIDQNREQNVKLCPKTKRNWTLSDLQLVAYHRYLDL